MNKKKDEMYSYLKNKTTTTKNVKTKQQNKQKQTQKVVIPLKGDWVFSVLQVSEPLRIFLKLIALHFHNKLYPVVHTDIVR